MDGGRERNGQQHNRRVRRMTFQGHTHNNTTTPPLCMQHPHTQSPNDVACRCIPLCVSFFPQFEFVSVWVRPKKKRRKKRKRTDALGVRKLPHTRHIDNTHERQYTCSLALFSHVFVVRDFRSTSGNSQVDPQSNFFEQHSSLWGELLQPSCCCTQIECSAQASNSPECVHLRVSPSV